jgi:APA family basic amino acid/polyamine antiporter
MYQPRNEASVFAHTPPEDLSSALAVAFIGVLWSYGGWHHVSFMAGEAKDPQRTVPRAMMIGAAIVTLVYVLANLAYMRMLPIEQLANSKTVAADAMSGVFSGRGIPDGLPDCPEYFRHHRHLLHDSPADLLRHGQRRCVFSETGRNTPEMAHSCMGNSRTERLGTLPAGLLGTFENLIEYVTFMDWLAMMMVGTTIFIFRKKKPDTERGYKTHGYPVTSIVFVAICLWFVLFNIVGSRESGGRTGGSGSRLAGLTGSISDTKRRRPTDAAR